LHILDDLFLFSRDWAYVDRIHVLSDLAHGVQESELAMLLRIESAEVILRRAIVLRQQEMFKHAIGLLPECERPLREAQALARGLGRITKAEVCESLLESVEIEMCIARALQAIDTGDVLVRDAVFEREHLSLDALWDAVNWYHDAILLSHERDVESEAIALSRLGRLYRDVMKMPHRAREFFHRALLLAASLQPRNLAGVPWFDEAAGALRELQLERARTDEEAQARRRAPYLEELSEALGALRRARDLGTGSFLEALYASHPPRDSAVARDASVSEKKQVVRAMFHYHPDRNGEDRFHDPRWAVLCEEITKHLAHLLNRMKGL
jgi:hypothetical protein